MRVDDFDGGDPVFEHPGRHTPAALERELHVIGGDDVSVVEAHALAQDELVGEATR